MALMNLCCQPFAYKEPSCTQEHEMKQGTGTGMGTGTGTGMGTHTHTSTHTTGTGTGTGSSGGMVGQVKSMIPGTTVRLT